VDHARKGRARSHTRRWTGHGSRYASWTGGHKETIAPCRTRRRAPVLPRHRDALGRHDRRRNVRLPCGSHPPHPSWPSRGSSLPSTQAGHVSAGSSITKTGNAHLRRVLVEAAWSYRHRPAIGAELRKRSEGRPAEVSPTAGTPSVGCARGSGPSPPRTATSPSWPWRGSWPVHLGTHDGQDRGSVTNVERAGVHRGRILADSMRLRSASLVRAASGETVTCGPDPRIRAWRSSLPCARLLPNIFDTTALIQPTGLNTPSHTSVPGRDPCPPHTIHGTVDCLGLGALLAAEDLRIRVPDEVLLSTCSESEIHRGSDPFLTRLSDDPSSQDGRRSECLIDLVEGHPPDPPSRIASGPTCCRAPCRRE
jgi:hypothetical protein